MPKRYTLNLTMDSPLRGTHRVRANKGTYNQTGQSATITYNSSSGLDSQAGDEAALQDFYTAMGGANWTNNTGWSADSIDLDQSMFGVFTKQVNGETRVDNLNLSGGSTQINDPDIEGNNLTGNAVPDSFGNLKQMTELRLKGNNITARIDNWIQGCLSLERVSLSGSGSFGGQDELDIDDRTRYNHPSKNNDSFNKWKGSLPDLNMLTSLDLLEIMNSDLSGALPENLPDSIRGLFITNNKFTSTLPAWSNCTNMSHLYIGNRYESYSLYEPTGVSSATSTTLTDTSQNFSPDEFDSGTYKLIITGGTGSGQVRTVSSNTNDTFTIDTAWDTIPDSGSEYRLMVDLGFSGSIPSEWNNMTQMGWFSLETATSFNPEEGSMEPNNNLSGTVPEWTGWVDLRYYETTGNGGLTQTFPNYLFTDPDKNDQLHTFDIGNSGASGTLTDTTFNISGLVVLAMTDNEMTGDAPAAFVTDAAIIQLNLRDNSFDGTFADINGSQIRWVNAQNNNFQGSLPDLLSPGSSDNFTHMKFQNNQFTSDIPTSYGQITAPNFDDLDLSDNLLDGSIPAGIFGNGWSVNISSNKYTPKNLVPILGENLTGVTYLPQKNFGTASSHSVGDTIDFSAYNETDNSYQWYKDGSPLSGETSNTIDTTSHGAGTYYMEIDNTNIAFTFTSEDQTVS